MGPGDEDCIVGRKLRPECSDKWKNCVCFELSLLESHERCYFKKKLVDCTFWTSYIDILFEAKCSRHRVYETLFTIFFICDPTSLVRRSPFDFTFWLKIQCFNYYISVSRTFAYIKVQNLTWSKRWHSTTATYLACSSTSQQQLWPDNNFSNRSVSLE